MCTPLGGICSERYLCGDYTLQGNALVTFVVISIPIACSNYPCSFSFCMFVNSYLLLDAYNHSKPTLDFMQTTTVRIVKRKKLVFNLKGGVWPSSLYKRKVKSYGETISLSSNYASTHIFRLSHLLAVSGK